MSNASASASPLEPGSLAGKRALVTGSSRGIGADTVQYLADAGAAVAINYRNKEARAVKLADAIRAQGGTAITVGADLTDPRRSPRCSRPSTRSGAASTSWSSTPPAAWSPGWPRTTPCGSTATPRSTC